MFTRIVKLALTTLAVVGLTVGVSACSSTPAEEPGNPAFTAGEGTSISGTVELATANGQTINAMVGANISIASGLIANDKIEGSFSDGSIAKFTAGKVTSNSTSAPIIEALKAGSTQVTLKFVDADDVATEVTFTLNVVAPAVTTPTEDATTAPATTSAPTSAPTVAPKATPSVTPSVTPTPSK